MFHKIPDPNPNDPRGGTTAALLRAVETGAPLEQDKLFRMLAVLHPHKPPARPRTVEAWVASARAGKYDLRDYLRTPARDGGYLIASDGISLHAAATTAPAGRYSLTGERLGDFPAGLARWRDVACLDTLGRDDVPFASAGIEYGLSALGKDYVRAVRVTLPDGDSIVVQRALYDRAVTLPGRDKPVAVSISNNRARTLRIKTTCGFAVIAGVRE